MKLTEPTDVLQVTLSKAADKCIKKILIIARMQNHAAMLFFFSKLIFSNFMNQLQNCKTKLTSLLISSKQTFLEALYQPAAKNLTFRILLLTNCT